VNMQSRIEVITLPKSRTQALYAAVKDLVMCLGSVLSSIMQEDVTELGRARVIIEQWSLLMSASQPAAKPHSSLVRLFTLIA